MDRRAVEVLECVAIAATIVLGMIIAIAMGIFLCGCALCAMVAVSMVFGAYAPLALFVEFLLLGVFFIFQPSNSIPGNLW